MIASVGLWVLLAGAIGYAAWVYFHWQEPDE